jgi:hypothetical protein
MVYFYLASAPTILTANMPAGATSFVLTGLVISGAAIDIHMNGILVYDDGPSAAVTVLDTMRALTGLNIQFDMRGPSATLTFTVTGGTTPNGTIIGYWK